MTNEQIIWMVVIALAALVLIGLILASMRKRGRADNRVRAQQLRQVADGDAAGLPDVQARAEQAATQAEHKRLEAERAEKEALRARTELDQERARHEDQIRAADRLDPDVKHKAKDYSPQVADPAGPSNIHSDPTLADRTTSRATSTDSASDPDTILDQDGPTNTAPRDERVGTDEETLRDRLEGDSPASPGPTPGAGTDTEGTHRA